MAPLLVQPRYCDSDDSDNHRSDSSPNCPSHVAARNAILDIIHEHHQDMGERLRQEAANWRDMRDDIFESKMMDRRQKTAP